MLRCRTCVMPNTRPDTPFIDGECAACVSYKRRPTIDWDERKAQLLQLLDRHHGRCVVPSSGGKDSTTQALTLKALGADVTAVTATTCYLTPVGRTNIDNLARQVRTIEVTPRRDVRAKLNRLGLELVGDISHPEHMAIFSTPFRIAKALGIGLLFFGECPQDAWGGPVGTEDARQMTRRWVSEFGGLLGLRADDFVGMEGITERDMLDYQMPDDLDGIEAHFLGQYLAWDSRRNAEFAEAAGMVSIVPCEANWLRGENMDCAMTGAHDFLMWKKYQFGRGCQQISADVRHGRIDRADALAWVEVHDGLFPEVYAGVPFADVLAHIGMTRAQFDAVVERFTGACSESA